VTSARAVAIARQAQLALPPALAPLRVGSRAAGVAWLSLVAIGRARVALESPLARATALAGLFARVLEAQKIELEVRGVLPAMPAVIVANHVSWLDPLLVGAVHPCAPIAKAEVGRWPIVGAVARAHGVLLLDRSTVASGVRVLRGALRDLEAGVSVLNFPEGTTTRGDDVLPFKRGVFGLAARIGVPIVPIAIRYEDPDMAWTGDASFLPHYVRASAATSVRVQLSVAPMIRPSRHDDPAALGSRARSAICALLAH
jgi:1-acyl-sn-glycerol-3-phosphate acyltransferase